MPAVDGRDMSGGVNKGSPDYGSWKPVVFLAIATVTPLALTLNTAEPVLLGVGCVLAGCLTKLTFNPSGPTPTSYDKKVESKAIKSVVITSDTNRIVRLLLGGVYLYAGATFSLRMLSSSPERMVTRLSDFEPYAYAIFALTWLACLVDFYIGGIWLSSGWCGQ